MKNRFVFLSIVFAAAVGLSGSAYAQAQSAENQHGDCARLEKKFDSAKTDHVSAEKLKSAREQRELGGSFCAKGEVTKGEKALHLALEEIGVIM